MTCDIFIKSFSGDYEWLKYCLRSIQRFATGFRRVIVVVPEGENPPTGTFEQVHFIHERGDGYMNQQVVKLHADEFTDAEFITYMDSDTIFTCPVCPSDLIVDSRRVRWLYTPYASLGDDGSHVWKAVTSKFIKQPAELEFMRRHPFTVPAWALREMRRWTRQNHGIGLEQYVLEQPNREFSEFNAIGAFLWYHHPGHVEWQNTDENMGVAYCHQSWSHNPLNDDLRAHLEAALA